MLTNDQRTRMAQALEVAKQGLEAKELKGGVLYGRFENLEGSSEPEIYELAEGILEEFRIESVSTRKLGSTEPDSYKALRDILNEIVNSREAGEALPPKPRPKDKRTADS